MLDMMPSVLYLTVVMSLLLVARGTTALARSSSAFCATNNGGVDATIATIALSRRRRRRVANDIIVVSRWKTMMTTAEDNNSGAEFHTHPHGRTYTVLDDIQNSSNDGVDDYDHRDDHDTNRRQQRWRHLRDDMQHVLRTMERAAYLAGELALSTSGKIGVRTTKANSRDLVTQNDLECQ
jgi:hypothetical protein